MEDPNSTGCAPLRFEQTGLAETTRSTSTLQRTHS
jgi:hypothetical protein